MQYALYDAATTGPLSGATMTVMGSNIANTSFLGVYVNGSAGNVHFVNSSLVNVDLPPASIPASESYADYTVYVCNGGRGPGGNCATFPFRYEYVLGEGWSSSVSAFYKFEGDLENAAHRAEWKMRGKIPKNYGDGGPFFTENKQGYPMQVSEELPDFVYILLITWSMGDATRRSNWSHKNVLQGFRVWCYRGFGLYPSFWPLLVQNHTIPSAYDCQIYPGVSY